jgi:Flp pilus assembly pilin Flp
MHCGLGGIKLDQSGATAIEYAMVAFFISIVAFSAIVTIGTDVTSVFSRVANSF